MVTDLNETEKSKRQASTDLATIEKIAKKPRNSLDDLTALAEEQMVTKLATPEWLGIGVLNVGGAIATRRRKDILQRLSRLGTPTHRSLHFELFKSEWDRLCKEKYNDNWPEIFLKKMKGFLNALPNNQDAFNQFIFDEEQAVFGGIRPLLVPASIARPYSARAL